MQSVRNKFHEYKQAFRKIEIVGDMVIDDNTSRGWNPSPRESIMVNFDVAIRGVNNFLGLVARSEDCKVIEARICKVDTCDPDVAEFMAVQKALLISLQNGLEKYCL